MPCRGVAWRDGGCRYSSQLEAQQKETSSAAATLEEAAREMDLIRTEKKALLQKWRSSLLQIERWDQRAVCNCDSVANIARQV